MNLMEDEALPKQEDNRRRLLRVLARCLKYFEEEQKYFLRPYGVKNQDFAVLMLLDQRQALPVQHLASQVLVSSGTMTHTIRRMESRGWVQKLQSLEDKRVFHISLTEAGKTLAAKLKPAHEAFLKRQMDASTFEEREGLIHAISRLQMGTTPK